MVLGQIVALVMVNKHKFHKSCFNTYKVIAKVKVCHNDDDDNDDHAAAIDNDTRVMTSRAKNVIMKTVLFTLS